MFIRLSGLLATVGIIAGTLAPAAAATTMNDMSKKSVHVMYLCDNLKVPVIYENAKKRAVINYGAKYFTLPQVMSADGARYLGHGLEWWNKGESATLSSVEPGKMVADRVLTKCMARGAKTM